MTDHPAPVERLVHLAFARSRPHLLSPPLSGPLPRPRILGVHDANGGRGVFSQVLRIELAWPDAGADPAAGRPTTVVVKSPATGPNGAFAMATGACRREALAYGRLLPLSPVAHPRPWLIDHGSDGSVHFVLEDLSDRRAVDQLDGLGPADAVAVAEALTRLHRHWEQAGRTEPRILSGLPVRRATPAAIAPTALAAGLTALDQRWGDVLDEPQRAAFGRMVADRDRLVTAFTAAGPLTLTHGDPRADNLVFDPDGGPVLFDWQQTAVQFGSADLAWLAATSLTPRLRRTLDRDLATIGGHGFDRYRLGFVLPGLAVLLLAQRVADSDRTARFIATSLSRIATALVDLEVDRAG